MHWFLDTRSNATALIFWGFFFTLMKREKTQSSKYKNHENSVTVLANYAIKAKI